MDGWMDATHRSFLSLYQHPCSEWSTDQSEAAEVEECVLDMAGSVCRQNELVKHTQQITVQLLRPFNMKSAWERENNKKAA